MFSIHHSKKGYWLLFALVIAVLQTSCEKEEEMTTPTITGLRAISPAPNDSALSFVTPGQMVVVQGQNFGNVTQLFFNGYPAAINPALNTNSSIVVTVPSGIVFTTLQPGDANTIKLVTSHGETVFQFPVLPPAPVINSISNEFAHAGETITLWGSYLYTVEEVAFPGEISVTSGFSSSEDGTSMQVTVPSGIVFGETDSIAITTQGGVGKHTFNNTTGILANFEDGDPKFGWQWWGGIKANDVTAFPGGWGNYIEIKPDTINAGDNSWWSNNRAVMVAASEWEGVDIAASPDNYALKFELFVKEPWTKGSLETAIAGNLSYMASYAPWKQTPNQQFVTEGWITVTIPLNSFVDANAKAANTVGVLTGETTSATVQIMLYNNSSSLLTSFDAAFDNVRVVKTN